MDESADYSDDGFEDEESFSQSQQVLTEQAVDPNADGLNLEGLTKLDTQTRTLAPNQAEAKEHAYEDESTEIAPESLASESPSRASASEAEVRSGVERKQGGASCLVWFDVRAALQLPYGFAFYS